MFYEDDRFKYDTTMPSDKTSTEIIVDSGESIKKGTNEEKIVEALSPEGTSEKRYSVTSALIQGKSFSGAVITVFDAVIILTSAYITYKFLGSKQHAL